MYAGPQRDRTRIPDRMVKLDRQERVGLVLVVVGVAGFAVGDVVGNLKRVVAIEERNVREVVATGGEREARELTRPSSHRCGAS